MPKSEQVEVESDFALNFLSSKLADFIGYLQEKKGGRDFPARADIAPREMQQWLPMISMYDVPAQGEEFRIRLMGTTLGELLASGNLHGQPISALPPLVYERKLQALNSVLSTRAPLRTFVERTVIPGQDFQSIEACYVPLSGNGTDINVIIALMQLGARP